MNLTLSYRSRSAIVAGPSGLAVALAPNLRRDRVAFDGTLRSPLSFREAVGALHDVVVSDLRYQAKDKSAYDRYSADQKQRENALRRGPSAEARTAILKQKPTLDPVGMAALEKDYRRLRSLYWNARLEYSDYLSQHDLELWRLLVPCDPVITVAPDCLFFECFSADESSYGCLTVDRDAFAAERDVALGTTNVDYSWSLYEHFQKLRSYRQTRFLLDPSGFEVSTDQANGHREEKIDLPPSWLKGFMQVQAAMSLPMRKVPLSREGLYNVLTFLKRHRAARSPRAVRFELTPGQPVAVVLEPWDQRIVLHSNRYSGSRSEVIRVWGRDRLHLLARLLPLLDEAEVYLLGTGLPSFWSIRTGPMRLLLGLSGWMANDWTGATAIDQMAPPADPSPDLLSDIAATFRHSPARTFEQIRERTGRAPAYVAAGLNRLALMGQLIHDLHAGVYRWRQVMPVAVSLDSIGPANPETAAARDLVARGFVHVSRDERRADGLRIVEGQVPDRPVSLVVDADGRRWDSSKGWPVADRPVSLLLDADGRMLRGKCTCSHHFTGGLRKGPCWHLQALRDGAQNRNSPQSLESWFTALGD